MPRNIVLLLCGIAASALLTVFGEGWMRFGGPGAYVVYYLFPPGSGPHDAGKVLFVHLGADFVVSFSILAGLYLLYMRFFRGRE